MNRLLRYGFLTWLLVSVSVDELIGSDFLRPVQANRNAPAPQPSSTRVVKTWYPSEAIVGPKPAALQPPAGQGEVSHLLVWVVDGAGDLRGCSNAMTHANMMAGNPAELSPFFWSHGYRRLLLDQTDLPHALAQGRRLAEKVLERRQQEPHRRVVIVAHSAGCAVALAAGDALPADSIDRMILLAPSVSTGYDVRPSLRAAREGMDVFCSKKDWVALGFVTRVVGTTDRHWARAAGRHGFQMIGQNPASKQEATRLRQHFWSPELTWTGHTGGHHGMFSPTFMHAYLFPLIGVRAG